MDSNELNCLIEKTKGILTNLKQQERDIKTEMRRASDDLEEGECESSDEETSHCNKPVEKPFTSSGEAGGKPSSERRVSTSSSSSKGDKKPSSETRHRNSSSAQKKSSPTLIKSPPVQFHGGDEPIQQPQPVVLQPEPVHHHDESAMDGQVFHTPRPGGSHSAGGGGGTNLTEDLVLSDTANTSDSCWGSNSFNPV